MSNGVLSKFDARLAVLLDDVAADVGVALASLDQDAVVAARVDRVLPDFGRAQLRAIRSGDLYAVLMAPLDTVLDQMRLVIVDLDTHFVEVK